MARTRKKEGNGINSKLVLWVALGLVVVIALGTGVKYYGVNIGNGILDGIFNDVMMGPTSQPASGSGIPITGSGCINMRSDIPLSNSFRLIGGSNIDNFQVQQISMDCNDPDNGLGTRPAINSRTTVTASVLSDDQLVSAGWAGTSLSFTDSCVNANTLQEYGCGSFCVEYHREGTNFSEPITETVESKIVTATIRCNNGCVSGACR